MSTGVKKDIDYAIEALETRKKQTLILPVQVVIHARMNM